MDYSRAPCLGADQKTRGLWERDCGKLIGKRKGAMVIISGWSSRYSRGMVGMVACSHAYPACYVARFIRVLDQCNTAGAVNTFSGC